MQDIVSIFPSWLQKQLTSKIISWDQIEEIRIRVNRPVEIASSSGPRLMKEVLPSEKDVLYMIDQLSQHSIYRLEEELRQGYITMNGGHRVGISGKVNMENGHVKNIRYFSSLNIRIARPVKNVSVPYLPMIYHNSRVCNVLLVGPPRCGKTTFLRDLTRLISDGFQSWPSRKVGLIDERSEIAACKHGVPQQDVGMRTDVMDACPKAEGMMMMIRSMSPDVLVVDEIGSNQDVEAIMEALHAGVSVIASVHGDDYEEIKQRPSLQPLFQHRVIERYIVFANDKKPGIVRSVLDDNGQPLSRSMEAKKNENSRRHPVALRYNLDRI
ncbi:stage III sporulation protein AA [Melghiribacillus thermohalophilus]|uniref:Stage III sporulation protein AA n=2 Tax=Melghiribacillus thermohalophilus TaxID=1324956 RepID=A0A4R3N0R7_9BACI|nr:stage III sporulation protein AA [Melghiribacillus thermohalophilus]